MRTVFGQLPVKFDRKFHIGSYVSGHAQLLFRSGRSGYHRGEHFRQESVIDVLFKNVAAIAVAENYYPLEILLAEQADLSEFQQFLGCEIGDRNLYLLRGDDSVGYVLAGAMYWVDDPLGSTEEPSVLVTESGCLRDIEVKRAR